MGPVSAGEARSRRGEKVRGVFRRARGLWDAAKRERATPGQMAWAVAVGVFSGCTPAVGFHGGLAVAMATLFRLNRLWCFLGSRVSNMVVLPFIVLAEIEAGTWLRTGRLIPLRAHEALAQGTSLLTDWCLGALPVGVTLAVVFGAVTYGVMRARARRKTRTTPADAQAA